MKTLIMARENLNTSVHEPAEAWDSSWTVPANRAGAPAKIDEPDAFDEYGRSSVHPEDTLRVLNLADERGTNLGDLIADTL
jgi:hypothetical protein